jgi:SAM-dependent methyltransferase
VASAVESTVRDRVSDDSPLPVFPAAERWSTLLSGWGVPAHILDQATDSPWRHDPARFVVDDTLERTRTSSRWAREVLPPIGGTVLDVGCGGGRSSIPLVPPANELIGVDSSGAMLDEYLRAATGVGVARRTIHGAWPDVAPHAPVADVVVCHHVAFNVQAIIPFLWALTDHARLAIVLEIPTVHPMSAWAPAWHHFWGIERPDGPTASDLEAVLREIGLDPEVATSPRGRASGYESDPTTLVPVARRRLCLPPERDAELAEWLTEHPPPWAGTMATFRWPGCAEANL